MKNKEGDLPDTEPGSMLYQRPEETSSRLHWWIPQRLTHTNSSRGGYGWCSYVFRCLLAVITYAGVAYWLWVVGRGRQLGVVKVASLSKTTKNKRTIHKQTQQVHADAIFSSHRVLTSIDWTCMFSYLFCTWRSSTDKQTRPQISIISIIYRVLPLSSIVYLRHSFRSLSFWFCWFWFCFVLSPSSLAGNSELPNTVNFRIWLHQI